MSAARAAASFFSNPALLQCCSCDLVVTLCFGSQCEDLPLQIHAGADHLLTPSATGKTPSTLSARVDLNTRLILFAAPYMYVCKTADSAVRSLLSWLKCMTWPCSRRCTICLTSSSHMLTYDSLEIPRGQASCCTICRCMEQICTIACLKHVFPKCAKQLPGSARWTRRFLPRGFRS